MRVKVTYTTEEEIEIDDKFIGLVDDDLNEDTDEYMELLEQINDYANGGNPEREYYYTIEDVKTGRMLYED